MGIDFEEKSKFNINKEKFEESFERIFGKQCKKKDCTNKVSNKADDYCECCLKVFGE